MKRNDIVGQNVYKVIPPNETRLGDKINPSSTKRPLVPRFPKRKRVTATLMYNQWDDLDLGSEQCCVAVPCERGTRMRGNRNILATSVLQLSQHRSHHFSLPLSIFINVAYVRNRSKSTSFLAKYEHAVYSFTRLFVRQCKEEKLIIEQFLWSTSSRQGSFFCSLWSFLSLVWSRNVKQRWSILDDNELGDRSTVDRDKLRSTRPLIWSSHRFRVSRCTFLRLSRGSDLFLRYFQPKWLHPATRYRTRVARDGIGARLRKTRHLFVNRFLNRHPVQTYEFSRATKGIGLAIYSFFLFFFLRFVLSYGAMLLIVETRSALVVEYWGLNCHRRILMLVACLIN